MDRLCDHLQLIALGSLLKGLNPPTNQFPNQVFSQKVLGDGLAIEPTDSVLFAPAGGEITVVNEGIFHACGILLENGVEILLFKSPSTATAMTLPTISPSTQYSGRWRMWRS